MPVWQKRFNVADNVLLRAGIIASGGRGLDLMPRGKKLTENLRRLRSITTDTV